MGHLLVTASFGAFGHSDVLSDNPTVAHDRWCRAQAVRTIGRSLHFELLLWSPHVTCSETALGLHGVRGGVLLAL